MPKTSHQREHQVRLNERSKRYQDRKDAKKSLKEENKEKEPKNNSDMSNLNNLIDAARIVESGDSPKPSKKSKNKPKETLKRKAKGGKNIKQKVKSKSSPGEKTESNSDSDSDHDNEIANIKQTMSIMMAKLEKLEGAKRKRKNKKGKKNYSSEDEDEVEKKPAKASKKDVESHSKTKTATENASISQPDYNMHLFQQMYMMQQMNMMGNVYTPFMVPPLNIVQTGMGVASNSFSSQMMTPTSVNTKSISSIHQSGTDIAAISPEKKIDSDLSDSASSEKTTRRVSRDKDKSEVSQDGYETDASEVYEPTKDFDKYISTDVVQPTKSFLGFVDEMNKDENRSIQSMVVSSTKRHHDSTKDKQGKLKKMGNVKAGKQGPSLERNKSLVEDVQPTSNVAGILINLMPQKQTKTTKLESDEKERPVINNTLKALFRHQSCENKALVKSADSIIRNQKFFLDTPRDSDLSRTESVDQPYRPVEGKRYVDNGAWLRDCSRNFHLQDQDGDTILHILIAKEEEDKAIDVIKQMRGYRLDILNALGQTPLHLALYTKSYRVIETLLQHGADISIVDAHGNSPIHIACEENSLEMMKILFNSQIISRDKCASIMKIRNNQGMAAIHLATSQQNRSILKFLIDKGVDLNIQESRSGNTPLLMALAKSNWDLASEFMEKGANINIPNFSNCYPLHLAVQGNNMIMVKQLLHSGAETGSKANDYDHTNNPSQIKTLLAKEMRKRRRNKQKCDNV